MPGKYGISKSKGNQILELFLLILGMGAFFYFIPLQAKVAQSANKESVRKSCPIKKSSKSTGEKTCAGIAQSHLEFGFTDKVINHSIDSPEPFIPGSGDDNIDPESERET